MSSDGATFKSAFLPILAADTPSHEATFESAVEDAKYAAYSPPVQTTD